MSRIDITQEKNKEIKSSKTHTDTSKSLRSIIQKSREMPIHAYSMLTRFLTSGAKSIQQKTSIQLLETMQK